MYATDTLRLQILKVIEQMRFPPTETKLYFLNQKKHIKKNRIFLSTDNQMKSSFRFHLVPRFS